MASETSQGTASISPPATPPPPPIPKASRRRSVAGKTVPKCEVDARIDAVTAAVPAEDHESKPQKGEDSVERYVES